MCFVVLGNTLSIGELPFKEPFSKFQTSARWKETSKKHGQKRGEGKREKYLLRDSALRDLELSGFRTFKLREKTKKQEMSPGCFDARQFLNMHRSFLTSGNLPVLILEAEIGKTSRMLGFLTRGFALQPLCLAGDVFYWSYTTWSFQCLCWAFHHMQSPAPFLLPWLMPVLLNFETSSAQGSIIQSHF